MQQRSDEDTAARLGGDEFCTLYTEIPNKITVKQSLERLLKKISEPYLFDNAQVRVSASIGVALFPEHGETSSLLLHHADQLMYQAKENGKNQIFIDLVQLDDEQAAKDGID